MQLGKTDRAKDFLRLDAGSEWFAYLTVNNLLREGKLSEARDSLQHVSTNPYYHRDFFEACLQPKPPSDMDRIAHQVEIAALADTDSEPQYFQGVLMMFCGRPEIASRLLKNAIGRNYCAYSALQNDPLLVKFRGTPEFGQLLSFAKECQEKFLKERNEKAP